jgi:hypothetical protein
MKLSWVEISSPVDNLFPISNYKTIHVGILGLGEPLKIDVTNPFAYGVRMPQTDRGTIEHT